MPTLNLHHAANCRHTVRRKRNQAANLPGWEKEDRWIGIHGRLSSLVGLVSCWPRPQDARRLAPKCPRIVPSQTTAPWASGRRSVSAPNHRLPSQTPCQMVSRAPHRFQVLTAPFPQPSAKAGRKPDRGFRGAITHPKVSISSSTNQGVRWASLDKCPNLNDLCRHVWAFS